MNANCNFHSLKSGVIFGSIYGFGGKLGHAKTCWIASRDFQETNKRDTRCGAPDWGAQLIQEINVVLLLVQILFFLSPFVFIRTILRCWECVGVNLFCLDTFYMTRVSVLVSFSVFLLLFWFQNLICFSDGFSRLINGIFWFSQFTERIKDGTYKADST